MVLLNQILSQNRTFGTMDADMLRYEQNLARETDSHSYFEQHNSKSSLFFQVLPAVVQNRMPNMPSIRQSISDLRRTRGSHGKNSSMSEESLPATPPPEYVSRPGTASATPYGRMGTNYDVEDGSSVASSASSIRSLSVPYETATGISWQHAKHGRDSILNTGERY